MQARADSLNIRDIKRGRYGDGNTAKLGIRLTVRPARDIYGGYELSGKVRLNPAQR